MNNYYGTFTRARIFEIELSQPIPDLPDFLSIEESIYARALILVKLHSQPLGLFEFTLDEGGLSGAEYLERIWQAFEPQIRRHLRDDGFPESDDPLISSLASDIQPACYRARQELLENAPLVSVVIATRNRTSDLATCLDSIFSVAYPNFEIIVVDNAPSTEATAELIRDRYADRWNIRYVREDTPGLAVAHNRGLREVRAPFVVFTDDDVLVDVNWLTEIVRAFKLSEEVACVTGLILPFEMETPAQDWAEQFGGFSKGFNPRLFDIRENALHHPLYPYSAGQFGSGANMAFRTSVLHQMGGFDPALGAGTPAKGGDDLASFFDIVTSGYKLVYQPSALIYHRHRRDFEGLNRQTYGYGVGLAAYLTKSIIDQPRRIMDILNCLPYGLQYIFSPNSPKNKNKRPDYPSILTSMERQGMLVGIPAYLYSRWKYRKLYPKRKQSTSTKQANVSAPIKEKSH